MTEYIQITDPVLQSRVKRRYGTEIAVLHKAGFCDLAYKLESLGPFSAVLRLPIVWLMHRAKEVLVFPFPWRIAAAYPLLVHSEPSSIADCMGIGIKFYSSFSDNSILISSTLESHAALQNSIRDPKFQIVRNPPRRNPEDAWQSHKWRIGEMQAQGITLRNISSFADYVEISRREELDLKACMSLMDKTA